MAQHPSSKSSFNWCFPKPDQQVSMLRLLGTHASNVDGGGGAAALWPQAVFGGSATASYRLCAVVNLDDVSPSLRCQDVMIRTAVRSHVWSTSHARATTQSTTSSNDKFWSVPSKSGINDRCRCPHNRGVVIKDNRSAEGYVEPTETMPGFHFMCEIQR